jgi:HK97 family phage major capsid protein
LEKKSKFMLSLNNLQHFAAEVFNPANVVMQDFKSGTVPTEFGTAIIGDVMNGSAVMKLATYEEMTAPKKKFSYMSGEGMNAYWVDEGKIIQTTKPTMVQSEMEAKKLAVIVLTSKENLKFSMSNFFNEVKPLISEAFYKTFDLAALWGTNSPYATGQSIWSDITTAGNTVALDAANVYGSLNSVIALLEDEDADANGFVTRKSFNSKLRGAVDANGRPLFNEATGGAPNTIAGESIAYVPKGAWDAAKAELIAGDWNYARYGILQDMEYEISTDAQISSITGSDGKPINLFERGLVAMRVDMHIAFHIAKVGNFAALTPDVTP